MDMNNSNGPRPGSAPTAPTAPATPAPDTTHHEILNRIDTIIRSIDHVKEATVRISAMAESGAIDCEDIAAKFINGIVDVVRARETTNQQAIALLRDMLHEPAKKQGVSGASIAENAIALGLNITDVIENMPPEQGIAFTRELLGM